MKDLIKKVKEILTILIPDYLKEFLFGVSIRSAKDAKPMDSEKDFYIVLQKEMKEFRQHYKRK